MKKTVIQLYIKDICSYMQNISTVRHLQLSDCNLRYYVCMQFGHPNSVMFWSDYYYKEIVSMVWFELLVWNVRVRDCMICWASILQWVGKTFEHLNLHVNGAFLLRVAVAHKQCVVIMPLVNVAILSWNVWLFSPQDMEAGLWIIPLFFSFFLGSTESYFVSGASKED